MKFSVCIDAVLKGSDSAEKIRTLKKLGVSHFEFWSWWDKDLESISKAMEETGLGLTGICTKLISLTQPELRSNYIDGLQESIKAAEKLGCKILISQIGDDSGKRQDFQHQSIVDGLKACVPFLEEKGITLLIEPLNTLFDHKGCFLWKSSEAFQIINEVCSENVKVLYDIYHQQIMEGNILNTIAANLDKIGHIHAAGLPGRNELYYSELDYDYIFEAIDRMGYKGFVGLEYNPKDDPMEGIKKYITNKQ